MCVVLGLLAACVGLAVTLWPDRPAERPYRRVYRKEASILPPLEKWPVAVVVWPPAGIPMSSRELAEMPTNPERPCAKKEV